MQKMFFIEKNIKKTHFLDMRKTQENVKKTCNLELFQCSIPGMLQILWDLFLKVRRFCLLTKRTHFVILVAFTVAKIRTNSNIC